MGDLSRREFTAIVAGAAVAPFGVLQTTGGKTEMSVQALMDRIKSQIGVEWRAETVDGTEVPAGATVSVLDQRGTRLVVSGSRSDALPTSPPIKEA